MCHCRRCYLAMKESVAHINVAEIKAVIKGSNLVLKWGLLEIEVNTHSELVEESVEEMSCRDAHKVSVRNT